MLTDRQIQAAIRGAVAELTLSDGAAGKGTGSLRLRIRPTKDGANATWLGWWKSGGQRCTKTLGRYPDVSLRDARERFAAEVRDVLAAGRDPNAAPAKIERATVERLFRGYIDSMREAGRRSADEVEGNLLRFKTCAADALGRDKLAADVTPGDVSHFLAGIYERGARVRADRMRAYLSAAFNWGLEAAHDYRATKRQDWGITANPVGAVRRDTDANKARDRNLSADELRALWWALDGEGFRDGTGAAIRLLITCGQRVRETLRLEGRDVDLSAGVWTMPASKTKGGRPHALPLPALALPILRQLVERHGAGPLFPGRFDASELQGTASLNRAARRWSRAAGMDDFQARDIRRTWKSRAADAGIDRFTRDLIQQHAQGGDTGSRHYDRADYMPQMRQAMNKWNAWLEGVL